MGNKSEGTQLPKILPNQTVKSKKSLRNSSRPERPSIHPSQSNNLIASNVQPKTSRTKSQLKSYDIITIAPMQIRNRKQSIMQFKKLLKQVQRKESTIERRQKSFSKDPIRKQVLQRLGYQYITQPKISTSIKHTART